MYLLLRLITQPLVYTVGLQLDNAITMEGYTAVLGILWASSWIMHLQRLVPTSGAVVFGYSQTELLQTYMWHVTEYVGYCQSWIWEGIIGLFSFILTIHRFWKKDRCCLWLCTHWWAHQAILDICKPIITQITLITKTGVGERDF